MSAEVIIWCWGGRVEVVEGEGVSWGERSGKGVGGKEEEEEEENKRLVSLIN